MKMMMMTRMMMMEKASQRSRMGHHQVGKDGGGQKEVERYGDGKDEASREV